MKCQGCLCSFESDNKKETICSQCYEDNEKEWDKARVKVTNTLNPKSRAEFLAMDMKLQRRFMLEMMEDGII